MAEVKIRMQKLLIYCPWLSVFFLPQFLTKGFNKLDPFLSSLLSECVKRVKISNFSSRGLTLRKSKNLVKSVIVGLRNWSVQLVQKDIY